MQLEFAVAQLTKGATSFGQNAPNTAVVLAVCGFTAILTACAIIGVDSAVEAMKDNGWSNAISVVVGLYAALLGAAQDRPRE